MKIKKACKQCGKEFEVYPCHKKHSFCSSDCRGKFYVERFKYTCIICGNIFHRAPSNCRGTKGKYCSKKCHDFGRRIYRICPQCGISYYRLNKHPVFCSNRCRIENIRKNQTRDCLVCGKSFRNGGAGKSKNTQFCSKSCAYVGRDIKFLLPNRAIQIIDKFVLAKILQFKIRRSLNV